MRSEGLLSCTPPPAVTRPPPGNKPTWSSRTHLTQYSLPGWPKPLSPGACSPEGMSTQRLRDGPRVTGVCVGRWEGLSVGLSQCKPESEVGRHGHCPQARSQLPTLPHAGMECQAVPHLPLNASLASQGAMGTCLPRRRQDSSSSSLARFVEPHGIR